MHCSYIGKDGHVILHSITADPSEPELDQVYRMMCKAILVDGEKSSPRGMESKEILDASFYLSNPRNRVISSAFRSVKPKYLVGEFIWYLTGSLKVSDIIRYSKFWSKLADENGMINSNYGEKILWSERGVLLAPTEYESSGVSQMMSVAKLLWEDPDSRRAIINIHKGTPKNLKDVPCTLTMQFFIRDRKLHLSVNMRSNDLVLGFSNDVFQFTMFQELLLRILQTNSDFKDLELGGYHHHAGSLHVYENHYDKISSEVMSDFSPDPENFKIATMEPFPEFESINQVREWLFYLIDEERMVHRLENPFKSPCTSALTEHQKRYASWLVFWTLGKDRE